MSHVHRFYLGPDTPEGGTVSLSPDETHHALHVIRVREEDPVLLFDGRGREWSGVVAQKGRSEVLVERGACRQEPPPARRLTVAQAWLDNDKALDYLVRRMTELGVERVVFFRASRSQRPVRLGAKLSRAGIEAAKQCGRLWLPELDTADALGAVFDGQAGPAYIATQDAAPQPLRSCADEPAALLLIGPEGDFTEEELRIARDRGALPVSLGPATFRAEVAAALGAALILYEWGQLGPLPPAG